MMPFMMFLYVLGLNYSRASGSGQDTWTKVSYAVLTAEESALPNVTALLAGFAAAGGTVSVGGLAVTTECEALEDSIRCTCQEEHMWSASVCEHDPSCCETPTACVFQAKPPPICFPNTRVTINGTLYLPGVRYFDSLSEPDSPRFLRLSKELETELKKQYSMLAGFEDLKITMFSCPCVTVDFLMLVNSHVHSAALIQKTRQLQLTLNGTFNLETRGLVEMSLDSPVRYGSHTTITCRPREPIGLTARWQLNKLNRVKQLETFNVTNGLESTLTTMPQFSSLFLRNATEYWAGQFICSFTKNSHNMSIVNKAQAVLDVALLPRIYIYAEPLFPRCVQRSTEKVDVRVRCRIERSSENYTVTWLSEGNQTQVQEGEEDPSKHYLIYTADTSATCLSEEVLNLTCTFRNRLDQEKPATLSTVVIYVDSTFCEAEGVWPDVKAGHMGALRCVGQRGERLRKCSDDGEWQQEVSYCVNRDLFNILEDAGNVAKGLGSIDNNSESLFFRLSGSTNDTGNIDSFANVDASVNILSIIKELNHTFKQNILTDFLQASSNLLSASPEKVWKNPQFENRKSPRFDKQDKTVAERYLESVEGLIEKTDMTHSPDRDTSNVQLSSCSTRGSPCRNTVFNVTVSMAPGSLAGVVKTAGFLHLAEYLPSDEADEDELNSIVVSTTFQSDAAGGRRVVEIDFPLIKKRPRNHAVRCAYWDAVAGAWSSDGCVWGGAGDPGNCVCEHLSAFTILMSKTPRTIPFLEEITYAGLAVSIVSLAVCLVIEALVWSSISRTKILHLRHTAHVNITLCLLVADCCFLASSFPEKMTENWCQVSVVLKHFSYLAMFFWMLCLSIVLLHQAVFVFHDLSRKSYLSFSFFVGYGCPGLIVAVTFISYNNGEKHWYYSPETCWLIYEGLMRGSIYTFLVPVCTIVIVNVLCMVVVILKLLENPKAEIVKPEDDKRAAKSILRVVILLTPIFGLTWITGFAVFTLDLTVGVIAVIMNYAFTILNAFQGFFILLTTYLGEKQVRGELLRRLTTTRKSTQSTSVSSVLNESLKKK